MKTAAVILGTLTLIFPAPTTRSSEPIYGSHLEVLSFTFEPNRESPFSTSEHVHRVLWRRNDYLWLSTIVPLESDAFSFSLQANERVFKMSADLNADYCNVFPSTHCWQR